MEVCRFVKKVSSTPKQFSVSGDLSPMLIGYIVERSPITFVAWNS